MGKDKRQKGIAGKSTTKHKRYIAPLKRAPKLPVHKPETSPKEAAKQAQHTTPTIPFKRSDRILLVGEGDLSYSASLVKYHHCKNVTATVFEKSKDELLQKYPHVQANINIVEQWMDGQDVENNGEEGTEEGHFNGSGVNWDAIPEDKDDFASAAEARRLLGSRVGKVLYNIDATKMGPFHDQEAKAAGKGRLGAYDSIQFMFPHCGGKSTDVNRQVRYNQELLVGFFKRALLSLAPGGTVVVTLFEGQPYELWGIRNLARHSGFGVERSFKFQASGYPDYVHARTAGVIRNKKGEISTAAWKGEERLARSYVFRRKDDIAVPPVKSAKKRKADADFDDDDLESDDVS